MGNNRVLTDTQIGIVADGNYMGSFQQALCEAQDATSFPLGVAEGERRMEAKYSKLVELAVAIVEEGERHYIKELDAVLQDLEVQA